MNISPIPVHGAFSCPKITHKFLPTLPKRRLKTGTFSASLISNTKTEFGNTKLEVRYERCKTCGSTKANFKSLFSRIAQRTRRRIYQAKQSSE